MSLSDDKLLKKVFSQSEAFNHFFKEVVVHVCLPDVVLTPLDWIESYEDENLLHHGAGKQDAKKVLTHLDSKNKWIYSVPNPLFQLIISTYKNVQWSPALASKRNIPTEGLFLLTFDEQLLLFDHSTGNKLASWSAYDRPESALFAVLTYCEIENIAPSEITIQLVSQESEDLMSILAPYVNVIQPFDSVTDDAVQDTYLINFLNQISYARN